MNENEPHLNPTEREAIQRTAYALGELSPDEARDVEQRLADDASLQSEVDATKALADLLERALDAEATDVPAVAGRIEPASSSSSSRFGWGLALAAALVSGVAGLLFVTQGGERDRSPIAMNEPETAAEPDDVPAESAATDRPLPETTDPVDRGVARLETREVASAAAMMLDAEDAPIVRHQLALPRRARADFGSVQDETSRAAAALATGVAPRQGDVSSAVLVNAVEHDYVAPSSESDLPVEANLAVMPAPWNLSNQLVQVAIQARPSADDEAVVARDAEVAVAFNPDRVAAFRRLDVGQEPMVQADQDVLVPTQDLLANRQLTAFYEVVPAQEPAFPSLMRVRPSKSDASPETLMSLSLQYRSADADDERQVRWKLDDAARTPMSESAVLLLRLGLLLNDPSADVASWRRLRDDADELPTTTTKPTLDESLNLRIRRLIQNAADEAEGR
ncbi:MAG: YfbK domain-containing protein [Planctomycetota bacterium]